MKNLTILSLLSLVYLAGCSQIQVKKVKAKDLYVECVNWQGVKVAYGRGGEYHFCTWALDCPEWFVPKNNIGKYLPVNESECKDREHCKTWQKCEKMYEGIVLEKWLP